MKIQMEPIGTVETKAGFVLRLEDKWKAGLRGLGDFGHVVVLWQAHQGSWQDELITIRRPYQGGPEEIGVFATRSPVRPNGIGLSVAGITKVDVERGEVRLTWIDALDGSPILDIKPYHPSSDRIQSPRVPSWCATWPRSLEQSATFDWSTVFTNG